MLSTRNYEAAVATVQVDRQPHTSNTPPSLRLLLFLFFLFLLLILILILPYPFTPLLPQYLLSPSTPYPSSNPYPLYPSPSTPLLLPPLQQISITPHPSTAPTAPQWRESWHTDKGWHGRRVMDETAYQWEWSEGVNKMANASARW